MTKRMIDADALDELLKWLDVNFEYCKDVYNIEKKVVSYEFLLKTINKLATPTEPKKSIFEEIPEIEGILEYYYRPEKTYHVNFQCSVLFGYGMTKEEAEKKRDEWNAGHDYEPPAGVFEDNSDFPGLCLEQYDDEFKLLLRDYIERKSKI